MATDRTNMSPESVRVTKQRKGSIGMSLPRSDDGNVHAASGQRSNTSAAHYADAGSKVLGAAASGKRKLASGR